MRLAVLLLVAGCGGSLHGAEPYTTPANVEVAVRAGGIDDIRCGSAPDARARRFRHVEDRIVSVLGRADHRATDLIAADGDDQQVAGALAYTLADKSLEDEDVDVFACFRDGWHRLGVARTDGDGRFALELRGADRLPIGMRDLYASVVGDRSGVRFLAYVAPAGTRLVVSDVDGTLTASENAFPIALFFDTRIGAQADAAATFQSATGAGNQLVYVTARGDRFTTATRRWLSDHGFPRGPLRLAQGLFTWPGASTVAFKTKVFKLLARRFTLAAGIGNRASDVAAYAAAGLAAKQIFIKLPEFSGELAPVLGSGRAIGFKTYRELTLR